MKTGYLCISAKTRKTLYVGMKYVSFLTTVLCVLYLGMVLHSLYRHRFLLHVLIISLFDDLYKNLLSLGILMFLLNGVCFKLNRNLKTQPTNHSLPRTHRVWVGLMLVSLLANASCVSLMVQVNAVVDDEVGPRLKHGMSRYLDTPSWGSALDRVQSYMQCCGVHGPTDWYVTAWIPLDKLSGHNVDNKLVQPTGRVQVPLVPTSCCRVVSAECGLQAWLETKTRSWADIKPADGSLLYTGGCEEAIKNTLAWDLFAFKVILLVVFILQVGEVVAARFLHTSSLNSVMLGRPQDAAPGWLLGPRLFRGKNRYGYLQVYDDRCHHIDTGEPLDDVLPHKTKWKCLSKMKCRKSDKESDSEGTQSTDGRKRRFHSPCLAKLKSTKCVEKLKTSCSRKSKKKKSREGEYVALESATAVESESDLNPEGEEMKRHSSDLIGENTPRRESQNKSGRRRSPERMRTGGDRYIEHRPSASGGISMRKKLSGNLIDVENAFQQNHESLEDYEACANQISPFSAKHSVDRRSNSKSPISDVKRIKKVLEPKKRVSVVVDDFKKRRELFENAGRTRGQTDSGKVEAVQIAISPSFPQSVNLIDLDAVESVKSLSMVGTSGTEITTLSSVKNEVKPRPIVLRNYPPLSPSE